MWDIEEITSFEPLRPADQLWLIALAVEENGGPAEYVRALRSMTGHLEEQGWWLDGSRAAADLTSSTELPRR